MRANFVLVLFFLNVCFCSLTASADEISNEKRTLLKGGIKGAALKTEDGLIQIGETAQFASEISTRVVQEATRKDTVVFRGPNLVGNSVIPWVGGDGGVLKFGDLPIRRNILNKLVNNIDETFLSLNSQIDALILPEIDDPSIMLTWNKLKEKRSEIETHIAELKELSSAKKLVNREIGREALAIYDGMSVLSKLSSQLFEIISANQSK
jgi:hypothetical protein